MRKWMDFNPHLNDDPLIHQRYVKDREVSDFVSLIWSSTQFLVWLVIQFKLFGFRHLRSLKCCTGANAKRPSHLAPSKTFIAVKKLLAIDLWAE